VRRHARVLFAVAALASFFAFAVTASAAYEFQGSFSTQGSGDGELMTPGRAAVEQSTGNLFVVDSDNNRVQVFAPNGSGTADYLTQFGTGLSKPWGIAIDESAGQTYVYVADAGNERIVKYSSDEAAVPSFSVDGSFGIAKGSGAGQVGDFKAPLAIDPTSHDLLVADFANKRIARFNSDGSPDGSFDGSAGTGSPGAFTGPIDLAVNSAGDVYVVDANGMIQGLPDDLTAPTGTSRALRYSAAGAYEATLSPVGDHNRPATVAVNPLNDEVVVSGEQDAVYRNDSPILYFFDGANQALSSIKLEAQYNAVAGMAFSGEFPAQLYLSLDQGRYEGFPYGAVQIQRYTQPAVREVNTGVPSNRNPSGATLNGSINPGGIALTDCRFEYGADQSLGNTVPCAESPGSIGSGEAAIPVHADVTGLSTGLYYFRLVAANALGTSVGAIEPLGVPGLPVILKQSAKAEVVRALVKATINPSNEATSYRIEYGTTPGYGQVSEEAVIAAGNDPVEVALEIGQLKPATLYHYRVVATNGVGEVNGADQTVATDVDPAAAACPNAPIRAEQGSTFLRHCRAFEQVSPQDKQGKDVLDFVIGDPNFKTAVADDGSAAGFISLGAFADSAASDNVNEYTSFRGAGGWLTRAIRPKDLTFPKGSALLGSSSDLKTAVVHSHGGTLAPGAVEDRDNLYKLDVASRSYQTLTPDPGVGIPAENAGLVYFGGGSSDLSTIVYEDTVRHTADAPAAAPANVYAWTESGLELVTILPDPDGAGSETGKPAPEGARLGDGIGRYGSRSNAVSDDGSRIFFTTPDGRLYVRVDGEETFEVSASQKGTPEAHKQATYWTATPDGRYAFFTTVEQLVDGDTNSVSDAYRYDVSTGELIRISVGPQPGDGVFIISGVSDDGSYAYFTSYGANYDDVPAGAGPFELNVWHNGSIQYVGDPGYDIEYSTGLRGTFISVKVSADGTGITFLSNERQPGADLDPRSTYQVFLYDAVADRLECASCRPDGGAPAAQAWLVLGRNGSGNPSDNYPEMKANSITPDGDTVFFNSLDPLVKADSNERFDAYEFTNSRPYLLSSGTGFGGLLQNASVDGSSVFFITRDRLTRSDGDENTDLYVARANGGFSEPPPVIPCLGESCKGPATTAPPQPGAGSSQFSGSGNAQRGKPKKAKKHAKKKRAAKKKRGAKKPAGKKRGQKSRATGSTRGAGK
jgi:hypothetical protein